MPGDDAEIRGSQDCRQCSKSQCSISSQPTRSSSAWKPGAGWNSWGCSNSTATSWRAQWLQFRDRSRYWGPRQPSCRVSASGSGGLRTLLFQESVGNSSRRASIVAEGHWPWSLKMHLVEDSQDRTFN
jgi:hypothetical protein